MGAVRDRLRSFRALAESRNVAGRRELHDRFVGYHTGYVGEDASVSAPREYMVVIGHRTG